MFYLHFRQILCYGRRIPAAELEWRINVSIFNILRLVRSAFFLKGNI